MGNRDRGINGMRGRDMKRALVVACAIVMAAVANAYASPVVDRYIQTIASLEDPEAPVPAAPKGCGVVRDEQTGDCHVLVPRDYCETIAPDSMVPLGHTRYGGQIIGYCQGF